MKLKGIYRWVFPFLLFLTVTFVVTKGYVLLGDILDNKAGEINKNKIIALNLPVKDDKTNEAFDLLKQKGYSFRCLILESNKKAEAFGVKTCPTTVLLDKNRKIIFRGRLSEAEKFINYR
ncbi:hypothetical protein [Pedobacter sp. HMWF019]|uniref:TlpA family protein disulfide reductase n=1 Tax=Pedobacter sp. HMWF019 TaxID=2056856 RepID=UPI0011B2021A|nr:hypothetical protein [Pedobacter sp. HMWF019]